MSAVMPTRRGICISGGYRGRAKAREGGAGKSSAERLRASPRGAGNLGGRSGMGFTHVQLSRNKKKRLPFHVSTRIVFSGDIIMNHPINMT